MIRLGTNDLFGYATSKSFATGRFKWIESVVFDSDKYSSNSLES